MTTIQHFIIQHSAIIATLLFLDLAFGITLIFFGLSGWKKAPFLPKWQQVSFFILVDVSYAVATFGRRLNTKDPGRQIAQLPVEITIMLCFWWALVFCSIASNLTKTSDYPETKVV
jgi:hypothetical protein